MLKRHLILFICFLSLFLIFALFQNFSNLDSNLNLNKIELQKYIPKYETKQFIGNMETPFGFNDYAISQNNKERVIFDSNKFLKETLRRSPAYKAMKDMVEVSSTPELETISACSQSQIDAHECPVSASEPLSVDSSLPSTNENKKSFKIKANPTRGEAVLKMRALSSIDTDLKYCAETDSVSVKFKQELSSHSNMQIKMESRDQSGSFLWSLSW